VSINPICQYIYYLGLTRFFFRSATTTPTLPATGGVATTTGFGQTVSATDTSGSGSTENAGSGTSSSSAAGSTGSSFSGAVPVKGGMFVGEATVASVLLALVGVLGAGLVV
jgi:hypothetical protein